MSRLTAQDWLQRIHALPRPERFRIMNVCGGHERAISSAGLRSLLPDNIELIPGPGCPVCVCPEEDIYQAMQLALQDEVVLVAFTRSGPRAGSRYPPHCLTAGCSKYCPARAGSSGGVLRGRI
jgi:hydrogenase expression/formation protein HypD